LQSSSGTARASGTCTFTMPQTPGTSEFRLFTNNSFTRLASSSPVSVGSAGPSLTASPNAVGRGGTITLVWNGISNATPADWIGLYFPGAGSDEYGDWIYSSSCGQSEGGSGVLSGSCTFTVPSVPGTYEFRLYGDNGYILLAKSGTVAVN
jgi:hypothetical protein